MHRCLCTAFLLLLAMLACPPASAQIYQDDFNDNAINNSLWEYTTRGFGPVATEINQRLEVDFPANSSGFNEFNAGYKSRFMLEGDFDVQVDYELLTWPSLNGIRIGFVLEGYIATNHRVSHISDIPVESYTVTTKNFSGSDFYNRIETTDLAGKLRMTRVGGVISGYYWNAATQDWTLIYSRGTYNQNAPVFLLAWSSDPHFGDQPVRVAFDNFLAIPYHSVSGRITLQGGVNQAQPITFEFRPTDGSPIFTKTVTLNPDRTYALTGIPPGNYNVWIKGAKWLAKVISVDTTNGSVTGKNATLLSGDADNNNIIDLDDLAILVQSFDADPTSPNWLDGRADFNTDDLVNLDDLHFLITNFDAQGDA